MFGLARRQPARARSNAEFLEAYRQASEHLKQVGKAGSVLVRLDIDEEGHVVSSRAIDPPSTARFGAGKVVLIDGTTGKTLPEPPPRSSDAEVNGLASDIARLLWFEPATRGGRAVRHRGYRMTIAFP